ncbi:MAG: DUF4386 domain-containing protein [Spirochaetaceae bacterium]
MQNNNIKTKLFGISFIMAFISYGLGSFLVDSISLSGDVWNLLTTQRSQFIIGILLIAFIHTIANIALPLLMVPTLKKYNSSAAYGYLAFAITSTVIMIIRALFSILLLPLSESFESNAASINVDTISHILNQGAFYSYHISMAIWGIGGLFFTHLLYRSKLIPKYISIWGFYGYIIFIIGSLSELFGFELSMLLNIPGGLFELYLSIWLIIKGFKVEKKIEVK